MVVFATLLNSVGIVIERTLADYPVTKTIGGTLEGCKDLTIAFTSLLFSSWVVKIGYRRTMLGGLLVVAAACALLAFTREFFAIPLLFILCGASFALVKVAVYSTVGLVSADSVQHAGLMNRLEGIYQVGAMASPLVFSLMIASARWTDTYWVLCLLSLASFVLWSFTPLDETEVASGAAKVDFKVMLSLLRQPSVLVFLGCAWFYVMTEQSIGTWMPTFFRDVFHLAPTLAAQILSVYFGSVALSRFVFGWLAQRFSVFGLQIAFLLVAIAIVVMVLLGTKNLQAAAVDNWAQMPMLVPLFAVVGFFIGPIYPTLGSIVLQRLERSLHSSMTGLIIVFSALGGTTGSQIIGYVSEHATTHTAFHFPLVPMSLLLILLVIFAKLEPKESAQA